MIGVHPLAHVDDTCEIHKTATIWQFASVTGGTKIGRETGVSPFAMLHGPVIGNFCRVSSGVAMGSGFLVRDHVFIGPNVTFCNDAWPRVHKTDYEPRGGWSVIVGDNASIGANSVILPGVQIGRGAMIAAGSRVDADVPDGCLWTEAGTVRLIDPMRKPKRMRFVR